MECRRADPSSPFQTVPLGAAEVVTRKHQRRDLSLNSFFFVDRVQDIEQQGVVAPLSDPSHCIEIDGIELAVTSARACRMPNLARCFGGGTFATHVSGGGGDTRAFNDLIAYT
jgi:hypothetical protein